LREAIPVRCYGVVDIGPQRELLSCPHRPPCPGCPRFGEPGIAPAAHAALNQLASEHGLPEVAVIAGPPTGFRHRARLAIRGRLGSPKLGLFEMDSHRVVHIPNCLVHHPLINHVASVVRRALVDSRISSYSEVPHLGLARYLQVVVERSSQAAQVVLVANSTTPEPLTECLNLIRERLGSHLHSLWFSANSERSNTILGPDIVNWCGPPSVVESFGGAQVHYPPGAFGQNNLDMAQSIIGHLGAQIPEGARITEFYAGVGAIGLSLLARARDIRMNETNPHSLQGLELGLTQLSPDDQARISVIPGPAGAAHLAAAGAQVVIADPPRKGLDSGLTGYLREQPPQRFLYVSCGLDSLLRDTTQLTSRGKLRLAALTAFDLLPYTEHVETVARFEPA
jgi:23S rRNA (uracil1939-C5)-methyltransferase